MAKNLRAIRKRIASIKNTQQLTKAMKMVAAAKLKRAQDRAVGSRPYVSSIGEIAARLRCYSEDKTFDLLEKREEEKKVAVLVYTSSRGLCGAFNSNLIRYAEGLVAKLRSEGKAVLLAHVGKKGHSYFKKRNFEILKFYSEIRDTLKIEQANILTDDLVAGFLKGDFDRVIVVASRFHSAAVNKPFSFNLIPCELPEIEEEKMMIFEPNPADLLAEILPKLVRSKIINALLESFASEQGSRMTAMEAATSNAGEILKLMTLEYNKARQAAITQELVEITSSAEALRMK